MNSYIDVKFVNLISSQLQQFKKKGDFLWNFRCPYCGDSQKSRTKARGFVYRKKNDLFYKCHNCGVGTTLGNLIKHIDFKIHKDYIFERYKKGVKTFNPYWNEKGKPFKKEKSNLPSVVISYPKIKNEPEFKFNVPVFRKKDILKNLKSISDLSSDHPARRFIQKRLIPPESFSDLYLCESFYKFTNTLIPNKFPSLDGDHPRLLIPFRDEQGEIFAYQGRSFGKEQPKYITIKLKDKAKIFGLDRVTKDKHIYVVEGPLDSLFLDNCIAVAGSSFDNPLMIGGRFIENDEITIIFDNEPRNKEICREIEKTITIGRNVCLWPEYNSHKDINDMIVSGYTRHDIKNQIKQFTFSGAAAKLRFAIWRKTNG